MKIHKQIIQKIRDTHSAPRLRDHEKNQFREELRLLMQTMPVRKSSAVRQIVQNGRYGRGNIFPIVPLLLNHKHMFATIAVILVLTLGGGVTYSAEAALPGDVLYPVKVHFNEEVRAAATFGAEADAAWDARRAGRRLEEAAALSATNRLDAEAIARIEERFELHADKAEQRIEKLQSKKDTTGTARAAAMLEASLETHQLILENLKAKVNGEADADVKMNIGPLINTIRAAVKENADTRAEAEGEVQAQEQARVEAAAQGNMKAAGNKIREVERFASSASAYISAEARAEAETKLNMAKETFAGAQTELEAGNYSEAFVSFGAAHRQAQATKAFVQAHKVLEVKLKQDVLIDANGADGADTDEADEDGNTNDQDQNGKNANAKIKTNVNINAKVKDTLKVQTDSKTEAEALLEL